MGEQHFASCRSCGRAFTEAGYGAQSEQDPRRCRDCWHIAYAFPVPSAGRLAFLTQVRGRPA